jgi:hypothetical protein
LQWNVSICHWLLIYTHKQLRTARKLLRFIRFPADPRLNRKPLYREDAQISLRSKPTTDYSDSSASLSVRHPLTTTHAQKNQNPVSFSLGCLIRCKSNVYIIHTYGLRPIKNIPLKNKYYVGSTSIKIHHALEDTSQIPVAVTYIYIVCFNREIYRHRSNLWVAIMYIPTDSDFKFVAKGLTDSAASLL